MQYIIWLHMGEGFFLKFSAACSTINQSTYVQNIQEKKEKSGKKEKQIQKEDKKKGPFFFNQSLPPSFFISPHSTTPPYLFNNS